MLDNIYSVQHHPAVVCASRINTL